ncbi:hypothetical protein [Synechococcus phage Ssp-JY40]
MSEAAKVAAGLTPGQRQLMRGRFPYRDAGAWRQWADLHLDGLVDIEGDFSRYKVLPTPLGLAVRAHLETRDEQ